MFKTFNPNMLIVLIGLSGSGKSYVAKKLAEKLGYAVLRSDEIRKKLAGLQPHISAKAPFGRGIYSEEMTKRVYKTLLEEAKKIISQGGKVILDATFLKKWQRELVFIYFPSATFIWVWAPEAVVIERLKNRKGDISDADLSVYRKQKEIFEPPTELLRTYTIQSSELGKIVNLLKF